MRKIIFILIIIFGSMFLFVRDIKDRSREENGIIVLAITGITAKFSNAAPDTIGIGYAIQYDRIKK